jgi:hypothetical protein
LAEYAVPANIIPHGLQTVTGIRHSQRGQVAEGDNPPGNQFREFYAAPCISLALLVEGYGVRLPPHFFPVPLALSVIVNPPHPGCCWVFIDPSAGF